MLIFIGPLTEDHKNGPPRICRSEKYLSRISYSLTFTIWMFHQGWAGLDVCGTFIKPPQMVWKSKQSCHEIKESQEIWNLFCVFFQGICKQHTHCGAILPLSEKKVCMSVSPEHMETHSQYCTPGWNGGQIFWCTCSEGTLKFLCIGLFRMLLKCFFFI